MLGNENDNANVDSNNIIFTIKGAKLYIPVVILSGKDNQKLLNLLAKDQKYQFLGMNVKQKMRIKIEQTSTDVLLKLCGS